MTNPIPLLNAVTVRLTEAEKEQLMLRSGLESRPVGHMARLLILQGLNTPPVTAQPSTTTADKP